MSKNAKVGKSLPEQILGTSLPNAAELAEDSPKRIKVSQADIPAYSLEEAMRVPRAIVDMALYGKRFILLVKEGVKTPSNLRGLYEVRYSGDKLDATDAFKLLESMRDLQNHPIPDRYKEQ